jgi:hypothetical protein
MGAVENGRYAVKKLNESNGAEFLALSHHLPR